MKKPIKRVSFKPKKKKSLTKKEVKAVNQLIDKKLDVAVEDRWKVETDVDGNVGQLFANASGHYTVALADTMTRGDDNGEFSGDLIKPKKVNIQLWFKTMQNSNSDNFKVRVELIKYSGDNPADFSITDLYDPNRAILNKDAVSIYDTTVRRRADYLDKYSVVHREYLNIRSDKVVGGPATGFLDFTYVFPKKQKLRYDSTGSIVGTSYRLVVFCDSGNRSVGTTSTLGCNCIKNLGGNTGLFLDYSSYLTYSDA